MTKGFEKASYYDAAAKCKSDQGSKAFLDFVAKELQKLRHENYEIKKMLELVIANQMVMHGQQATSTQAIQVNHP